MPAAGTTLFNWKQSQLSKKQGLDNKIEEEHEFNEGVTVWRKRRVRFMNCIAQKKSA